MKRKTVYVFIGLALIIFLTPLAILLGPNKLRDYAHKELVYKVIVDKIVEASDSDEEKAVKIFNYTHEHLFPYTGAEPSDVDALHNLVRNIAWCDSQAGTFVTLAHKVNIEGAWVGLKGWKKVSQHSVAVLKLGGKYRMFDPFYGYMFIRPDDGQIATLEDLQANHAQLKSKQYEALKIMGQDRSAYFKLYEPAYPWDINPLVWSGVDRKIISTIIDSYYGFFGRGFLVFFQDLYFKIEDTPPLLKARLKYLSYRYQSAINDYNDLMLKKRPRKDSDFLLIDYNEILDETLTSEIMFFKGQALWAMKDFAKSAESFESLLKEYPDTRWAQLVYFYLGSSYENLNKTDEAINAYERITTKIAETRAPQNLINLIRNRDEKKA